MDREVEALLARASPEVRAELAQMIADVMWEIEMWQALNGTPEQKAGFRAKLEAEEREAGLAKA